MKNIKDRMLLKLCFLASISILLFASCSNDDSGGSSGKLEVTGITKSVVDDPLVEGDREVDVPTDVINAGNYYIIRGSGFATLKSISFNGLESYFNPTFVTDNAIVILVDEKTPYYNEMDEMKIVTNAGTLNYKVAIRPPAPSITGFPVNANPGDVITITGDYFLRPVVNFGETRVEPMSATLTEIVVKVPEGTYLKNLSITNVSGTTVAPETIGSGVYDDKKTNIWGWDDLWDDNNALNLAYDKDVKEGKKCIEWKSGEWDGFVIGINNWSYHDTGKFKAIRFWIKGEKAGKVKFFANDVDVAANTKIIDIKSSWTYVEIPYAEVGNHAEISNFGFQEFGGFGGNVIYLDNIGFVLK
ncbi:IPT/TIG domain-containing protein [Flavobacterium ustbae]|uniref:IPT/TIG domain-containing protein n=1 Tax=Flavobacterium ustbae TaxID=2488790 RepID=UPI000F790BB6|nr:IPT/TIG domain-containing protein [Flavobacterium ustbae]